MGFETTYKEKVVKKIMAMLSLAAVLTLSGCGHGTKQDILKKAEGANTKSDLESKLGKPDGFTKALMVETWTYKGSDGEVTFTVVGDKVTPFTVAGTPDKK